MESGGPTQLNVDDVRTIRSGDVNLDPRRRSFGAPDTVSGHKIGGTVIPLFDGEVILLVSPGKEVTSSRPSSRVLSRPPSCVVEPSLGTAEKKLSRAPSIRVRPGSSHGHGLDRKASLARRNSLPSISARTSLVIPEHPTEHPVRVVVQAGTLERLVDILAHGLPGISVSISDDNGEMPLKDGRTRDAKLDRGDFSSVWWNVFRSFVTPLVFFEVRTRSFIHVLFPDETILKLLRKRYVSASNTNISSPSSLAQVAHVRGDIIEVLNEWLRSGGGSQDILDDGSLYLAIKSFLESPPDHVMPESQYEADAEVIKSWTNLKDRINTLSNLFTSQTLRPSTPKASALDHKTTPSGVLIFADLPDFDRMSPEGLVNELNNMAAAAIRNITEEVKSLDC